MPWFKGFTLGLLVAAVLLWAGVSEAGLTYQPVPFEYNSYNQGRDVNYPQGSIYLRDLPFNIPVHPPNNNTWDSIVAGDGSTRTLTIPVKISNVKEVHTLINLSWGSYGLQLTTLDFNWSGGLKVTKTLTDGVDVRDWWNGDYVNSISPPTVQVYAGIGTQAPYFPTRIDKQIFTFYGEAYKNRILQSIVITDTGSEGTHRAFLYGMTVGTAPQSLTWINLLLFEN